MIWVLMLAPFGVINGLLCPLGLIDRELDHLLAGRPVNRARLGHRDERLARFSLLHGDAAGRAAVHSAASSMRRPTIDGAKLLREFWYITLPAAARRDHDHRAARLRSGHFAPSIRSIVMTGGGPAHSSEVLATAIYFDGFQKLRFGYASARGRGDVPRPFRRQRHLCAPSDEQCAMTRDHRMQAALMGNHRFEKPSSG